MHVQDLSAKIFIHALRLHLQILLLLLAVLLVLAQSPLSAQTPADTLIQKRQKKLLIAEGAAYTGLMVGLNQLWYSGQPRSGFHFFNDAAQWNQVDKAGHAYGTYQLSRIQYQAFRWSGMPATKAALWSSLAGFAWLLPVEVLDGFSAAYGASASDLLANASGSLLYGAQQLLWGEQLIRLKYSFHPSSWAAKRPALLGNNLPEQLLKDYNGQTYWLSINTSKLIKEKSPRWLNVALGYGTSGMVYADNRQNNSNGFWGYRQLFLAPDINLSHIQTNKKGIKLLLFILDGIHLPMPAIEYSRQKLFFHPIYF